MSREMYYVTTALAALRLTRFVVLDDLGHWVIKGPYQRWAARREGTALVSLAETRDQAVIDGQIEVADDADARLYRYSEEDEPITLAQKISHGLNCPYCVGTWISLGMVGAAALAVRDSRTRTIWSVIVGGLASSYVIGQAITRLDESHTTEEQNHDH